VRGEHPLTLAAQVLQAEGLPYCLIGGYAVAVHGEPRATHDVDMLVLGSGDDFWRLFRRCKEAGWDCELRAAGPAHPAGDLVRIYSPFAGDFYRARPGLEADCVERSAPVELFGRQIRVARAEDLVLLLLRAGDLRGFYDAVGIVCVLKSRPGAFAADAFLSLAKRYGLEEELGHLLRGELPVTGASRKDGSAKDAIVPGGPAGGRKVT